MLLGLGAYGSSSEGEDEAKVRSSPALEKAHGKTHWSQPISFQGAVLSQGPLAVEKNTTFTETNTVGLDGPLLGPVQPPNTLITSRSHLISGQSSPFSTSRALIHDLTLPPVPDLNIPVSPARSPDPTTSTKFSHFLSLKKQGVHFNKKLSDSSSLKNPSLLVKLREHAGIDDTEQYATSLPRDIWDDSLLPDWAYKEELLKMQQAARIGLDEKKQIGQRESVEFVSSGPVRDGKRSMNINPTK